MKKLLPVVSFICLSSWFGVASPNAKTSPLDQTAGSEDVDDVIPFGMDKVMGALKPAMESQNCKVRAMTATRIECKRPRGFSGGESYGGESVTALLEAKDGQTRVRISTGKGFYGRLGKSNWSTPIYEEMMKSLRIQAGGSSEVTQGVVEDKTLINFAAWGYNPAASAHLGLVEMGRKNVKGLTEVTYGFEISGFAAGRTYMLWTMQSVDHKAYPIQGPYLVDATGKLVCSEQLQPSGPAPARSRCVPLEHVSITIHDYHKGEPADYLVVSTDGTVRAYARAYPFPIQAQDGKCILNVEIENVKFTSFVVRGAGFEPGDNIRTSSSFGHGTTAGIQQASARGEFAAAIQADMPGTNSGSASFAANGNSCNPTVTYEWGKAAMKVQ